MTDSSWNVVEPSLPALTYTYSFGPGIANALAVVVDGGVAVVSPPCNPPESAFTSLEKYGPVRALVAPNAYHHLGLATWKARFPDARIFAPAQSIARVTKHSKLSGIQPLAEAATLLGDRVEMIDMPHYKSGETLVRWRVEGGFAWYITDLMMNWPRLPKGPFGWALKLTNSGPGLRRNAISVSFMVKDKRSLFAWVGEQAEKTPPRLIVAGHGDVARLGDPKGDVWAALS